MQLFFVFIVLYPTNFNINHTPEEAAIGYVHITSIVLQELKILQISGTHVDLASFLLEVQSIYLFLMSLIFAFV